MRCSSHSAVAEWPHGVAPPATGAAIPMRRNDAGGQKCHHRPEVSLDARDVLAGRYDHIPLRVIAE
jgi:hypothetical protein